MNEVSVGALNTILTSNNPTVKDVCPNPVLQVLQTKLLQAAPGTPERYRIVFSDTRNFVQSIVASQCNHVIQNETLKKGGFVRLTDFTTNNIKGKKVLMVLDMEVLEHLGQMEKLGAPEAIAAGGEDEKPQATNQATTSSNFYGNQNQNNQSRPTPGVAPQTAREQPKFASNAPKGRTTGPTISPIESVSPYQNKWVIKARVTVKSEIKTWHNQRGEGKLFSVNLLDSSGEIKATGFNDQCDQLYDLFQEGQVYLISKCSVQMAKKQFSTLDNEYELTFQRDSEVEKVEGDVTEIPKPSFNITPLAQLETTEKDAVVDVVGVLQSIGDVNEITGKTSQKPYSKRDLQIVDNSGYSVKLTVWGKTAQNFEAPLESIVAFKGVKVSDFGGRSLSLLSSGYMSIDPDMDEAHSLKGWYEAEGRNHNFASHTGMSGTMGAAGGRETAYKTIAQAMDENLGTLEPKGDYFTLKATIIFIRQENVSYPACRSEGCNKKVIQSMDGDGWQCEKCVLTFDKPQHRYIMSISVSDIGGQVWLSCFDDVGVMVLGLTADQLLELKDTDEKAASDVFGKALGQTFIFRVRAKTDTYQETQKIRYQVLTATPMNYATEALKLAEIIKSYNIN